MKSVPKQRKQVNEALREFMRKRPCDSCGRWAHWNQAKGEGRNTASHVLTVGSGKSDINNLVSHCFYCHVEFEQLPTKERELLLPLAKQLTEEFLGVSHE